MQSERDVQRGTPVAVDPAIETLFPKKQIDPTAYTLDELCEHSGYERAHTARKVKEAVSAGTWEQVHKVGASGRVMKAYRPKK